jgi:hypothetical protein
VAWLEDALAPETIHNAVMLLRNLLAGRFKPPREIAFGSSVDPDIGRPMASEKSPWSKNPLFNERGFINSNEPTAIGRSRRGFEGQFPLGPFHIHYSETRQLPKAYAPAS